MEGVVHWKNAIPNSEEMFHTLNKLQFTGKSGFREHSIAGLGDDQDENATNLFFYYYPMWLQQYFEKVCSVRTKITTVLINYYDLDQWCNWHEDGLYSVATLSFGYSRRFRFKDTRTGKITGEYELDSGDLIIFHKSVQEDYHHSIAPLTQAEKDEAKKDVRFKGNRISMIYFIRVLDGEDDKKILSPFRSFSFDSNSIIKRWATTYGERKENDGKYSSNLNTKDRIYANSKEELLEKINKLGYISRDIPKYL